jgi:hypothetical protein
MIGSQRQASTKPKQGAESFPAVLLGAFILAFHSVSFLSVLFGPFQSSTAVS